MVSSDLPRRRSIRLGDYDYTQAGAYFVTICTHDRNCLLGRITDDIMRLSALGRIVEGCWDDLPNHHTGLALDVVIVMPNHVHGIILFDDRPTEIVPGTETGAAGSTAGAAGSAPTAIRRVTPGETGAAGSAPTVTAGDGVPGSRAGAAGSAPTEGEAAGAAGSAPTEGDDDWRKRTLGSVVRSFKSAATKAAREHTGNARLQLWQRGYYEHVIRSEVALARVRDYIEQNPLKWALDHDNPANWSRPSG